MLDDVNLPLLLLRCVFFRLELDHDEVFLGLDPLIEANLNQVVPELDLESWKGIIIFPECHLPLKVFFIIFDL